MPKRSRQRTSYDGFAGPRLSRRTPVEAHEGTPRDYLDRIEAECRAATTDPERRQRFSERLLVLAADTRNIRIAIEALNANGDTAAGHDRVRLRDISRLQNRRLWKVVRRAILSPKYAPALRRLLQVLKESGTGLRPIEIANVADRIIERALYQILQPFLDHLLDPACLGSRPGVSREDALLTAQSIAVREGRHTWLLEDLENAYTKLIPSRLLQILGSFGVPREVAVLCQKIIGDRRRGIPQGSPLSGLLLNIYLTATVDRPWRQRHPTVPLLHVVDDFLILLSADDDPCLLYRELRGLVQSAGMRLKGAPGAGVRRLAQRQSAEWLGFVITGIGNRLLYRPGGKAFRKLRLHLERCHEEANPLRAATETLSCWMQQMGPCYHPRYAERLCRRIHSILEALGLSEAVTREEVLGHWREAYVRFRALRQAYACSFAAGPADSSARQHENSAEIGRGVGDSIPPPGSPSPPMFRIWTDGSCLSNPGIGGWAYLIVDGSSALRRRQGTGSQLRATNNRMELLAVIRALEALRQPSRVTLFTDSEYVQNGARKVERWSTARHGFRGRRNGALWSRVAALLNHHQVSLRWTRGHRGNRNNNIVDRLARRAASQLAAQTPVGETNATAQLLPGTS